MMFSVCKRYVQQDARLDQQQRAREWIVLPHLSRTQVRPQGLRLRRRRWSTQHGYRSTIRQHRERLVSGQFPSSVFFPQFLIFKNFWLFEFDSISYAWPALWSINRSFQLIDFINRRFNSNFFFFFLQIRIETLNAAFSVAHCTLPMESHRCLNFLFLFFLAQL